MKDEEMQEGEREERRMRGEGGEERKVRPWQGTRERWGTVRQLQERWWKKRPDWMHFIRYLEIAEEAERKASLAESEAARL